MTICHPYKKTQCTFVKSRMYCPDKFNLFQIDILLACIITLSLSCQNQGVLLKQYMSPNYWQPLAVFLVDKILKKIPTSLWQRGLSCCGTPLQSLVILSVKLCNKLAQIAYDTWVYHDLCNNSFGQVTFPVL